MEKIKDFPLLYQCPELTYFIKIYDYYKFILFWVTRFLLDYILKHCFLPNLMSYYNRLFLTFDFATLKENPDSW